MIATIVGHVPQTIQVSAMRFVRKEAQYRVLTLRDQQHICQFAHHRNV